MLRMSPPQVTKSMQFKTDLVFGSACWHYKFQTSSHVFAAYLLSSCSHVYVLIMSCSCCCAWNPLNIYQIFKQWLFKAHSLQFQWVSYLCIKFSFREPNKKNVCWIISFHMFTYLCYSLFNLFIRNQSNAHISQWVQIEHPHVSVWGHHNWSTYRDFMGNKGINGNIFPWV